MIDILLQSLSEKKGISLYTNSEDVTKFIYGHILAVNEDYIAIYMVSPNGDFDGVLLKQTTEIFRLEIDTQYSEKMEKLQTFYKQEEFLYALDKNNILESMLLIAQQSKKIVAIEILNSGYDDIVGFVVETKNGLCKVSQVDEYGYADGVTFIEISDITQLSYDSQDERRILNLWNINQSI